MALRNAATVTVRLDDVDIGLPHQRAAEDGGDNVIVAVQLVDEWNHLLRQLEALVPIIMANMCVRSHEIHSFSVTGVALNLQT